MFRKDTVMNDRYLNLTPRGTGGALAVSAAALLVAGATWHGFAAGPQSTQSKAERPASVTTPTVVRANAGGRDSYADIVKDVAPSVVTIRVEGKSKASPTPFGEGDEFFRRFFGDPGERGPRTPQ